MSINNTKSGYMSTPSNKTLPVQLKEQADKLRFAASYKEAAGKYLNSIMLNKKDAQAYYGLGLCYKSMGKTQKAIDSLEKSVLLDSTKPEVFFELGLCHLKEETPCKAIKCFIQTIQLEPDNPEAIYHLGLAHEMAEEQDMALMIYQKLIENSPTYINAYVRKSQLLVKMELYKQALGLYMNVLKINPQYTKIYSDIGLCFDKLGNKTYAKRFYKKFLCSEPNDEQANYILKRVEKLRKTTPTKRQFSLV